MAQAYGPVLTFLIFLWILSLTEAKEVNVTCIFHEDCVLPCSFRPPGAVVIHWYKQQVPVHSYYYNKDQFGLQNKHFSGRTCLFNSQISTNGNASLHLRRVKVQDKGRYKCYTSTRKGNHESFVNLEVKALIQSVHIEMTDKMITCSSHNIYPVPQVAWATDPPSALDALQNFTTVKTPDIRGLFTVKSTLRMLGNSSDHAYFCSFVSADKAQVWTASRKNQEDMTEEEGRAFSIPCIAPRNLHNFSLTWTFTGSSEPTAVTTVIRYDSRTRLTFNLWDGEAGLEDQDAVQAGNGSLLLQHPESQEHTGTYICTFSGLQSRHTVQTKVNVTVAPVSVADERVERSWWSTAASATFFMFTIFVVLSQCLRLRGPGTRGLSHRHNGTGLNDGGHHEHLNPTVSYVTRPYAVVKDAIPQPEPHLQGELEGDIPKIKGNYSVGPQPNSTYMEHAEESAGPPMAGNCSLHTESEESGEVRHHMPCAQDLDLMGLASILEGDMVEQQTEDDGTRTDLLPQQDGQT